MRCAAGMALLLLAAVSAAQGEESKRIDPVVVTATKIETAANELGTSVSVANGDDFQTYLYPSVTEALRNIPGLEITQAGSPGKISTLAIRGANSNQVQVLIDGVRVKSPTTGQVDLSDISADQIERIEVIRGAQSTLYGADAIGGVVNIITKKGQGPPISGFTQQEGGNYDTFVSRGSAGGAYKFFNYAVSGSHQESNGQYPNDNSNINALNARVGLTLPWDSALSFVIRWNKNDEGLPVKGVFPPPQPTTPIIDRNQKQQSETMVMTLEGKTRPVSWWESRVRLSRFTNELGFQDSPDPGFTFESPIRSQIDVSRNEAEWVNAFFLGKWGTSTVGLEYRREEGDNKGVFSSATETWAVWGEQQLRFSERLFLTAGFRVEDNSQFGTHATGRGSFAYLLKEWGTRFHGSAGSGFRAPTLNDLFFPGFSNPNVKPEQSLTWDIGVDQKLWNNRIRLGATYFHTDFTDLIQTVPSDQPPFFSTVGNVGSARAQGVEFTSDVDILPNLVGSFNYTFTKTENLDTRNPLPRIPEHSFNIGLTWEPIRRLSLFAQVYIRSSQFENFGNIDNPGWSRVDIGATYQILTKWGPLQGLDLTAKIQNLLNSSYAEVHGFPALGINALVGLRARF
jgi:vitamin B12 transporter